MSPKKYKDLERLATIVFDLFPPEELRRYERNGVPLRDQYIEYCIKNTFKYPVVNSKRTIEHTAIFALHDYLKSTPKEEFPFEIFDVFFF